jgi:hypothetical protein
MSYMSPHVLPLDEGARLIVTGYTIPLITHDEYGSSV